MGVSLSEQATALACALALGGAAALLYDLLRAIRFRRRRSRLLTDALDALYCLALAVLFFAFALRIGGGELRLYMLFAAFLGAALYFALLARLFRPLWDFWAGTFFALLRLLRLPLDALKIFYGKLTKLCKRLFLFLRNCFIIKAYRRSVRRIDRRSGRKEERTHGRQSERTHGRVHAPRDRGTADHRHRGTLPHA